MTLHPSATRLADDPLALRHIVGLRIEPETMLPAQYFAAPQPGRRHEGELRLMLAILEDGFRCILKHRSARRPREKRILLEALVWINDESAEWIFSFESICGFLGIHPEWLRRAAHRLARGGGAGAGRSRLPCNLRNVRPHQVVVSARG